MAGLSAPARALDEVDPGQPVSETIVGVAAWAIASGDHRGLPFVIVDKAAAQVFVFGDDGRLRGMAPVLLGSARGDHSVPGVGDLPLSKIPPQDRTTPAGRFLAAYGPAPGGKSVLWVDYGTAVSLHPLLSVPGERRLERLDTPEPDDNRITHGCMNVSQAFYDEVVRPTVNKGGVFYVLPETTAIEQALPGYQPPRVDPVKKKRRWFRQREGA